jgi:hypothetical protein
MFADCGSENTSNGLIGPLNFFNANGEVVSVHQYLPLVNVDDRLF